MPSSAMNSRRLMCGWPPRCKRSFDDLVGLGEDQGRNSQSERLGSLEVDHQLEFGWLLDREVAGICPSEDLST